MELPKPRFFARVWKHVNLNRVSRIRAHYDAICGHLSPRTTNDKKEMAYFKQQFERYERKAMRLIEFRFLAYLLLYASITINVIKLIPVLSYIVPFIELGGSLFSTTFLIVLVWVFTARINLYIELLNESLTHLIVIYHKNAKRDTNHMLEGVSKTI